MPFPACRMQRARPLRVFVTQPTLSVRVPAFVCTRVGAVGLKHPRPAVWTERHLSPSLARSVPGIRHVWARAFKASPSPPVSHIHPHITLEGGIFSDQRGIVLAPYVLSKSKKKPSMEIKHYGRVWGFTLFHYLLMLILGHSRLCAQRTDTSHG